MDAESSLVRGECGKRRRAAHMRDPGPGRDAGSDLGDRGVGDAEEDQLRVGGAHGDAPLAQPRGDSRADAARADDVDCPHVRWLQLRSGCRAEPTHTRSSERRARRQPHGDDAVGCLAARRVTRHRGDEVVALERESRRSSTAATVAVRGTSRSSAISPKKSPGRAASSRRRRSRPTRRLRRSRRSGRRDRPARRRARRTRSARRRRWRRAARSPPVAAARRSGSP